MVLICTIQKAPAPSPGRVSDTLASGSAITVQRAAPPSPLLATVHVGANPAELAIDAAAGHVFVLNRGPGTHSLPTFGPSSVTMLDATTGRVLRTAPAGVMPNYLLLDARTSRVFTFPRSIDAIGGPGTRVVLDAATGRPLYSGPFTQVLAATISVNTGRVFALDGTNVWVINASTGRLLGRRSLIGSGLAVDERRRLAYVANAGVPLASCIPPECIGVLDAATGTIRSSVPPTAQPRARVGASRVIRAGLPFAPQQGEFNVEALAVDERSGNLVVDVGGRGENSDISIVNPRTQTILHSQVIRGGATSVIGVDESTGHAVAVNTPDSYDAQINGGGPCTVRVIDMRSGRLLRETTVATADGALDAAVAVDARRSRAYVVSQTYSGYNLQGHGHLSIFDTRTGRLLRTLPLGRGPQDLAIDQRSGRVFVSNSADGTVEVFDAASL